MSESIHQGGGNMMTGDEPQASPAGDRAAGLAALISRAVADGRPAPVDRWTPPDCGDIDMRITADGRWHYMGSPIGREQLVRLFARVLKREGDRYVLVTPVEKVGITVEDVPFLAVEMHAEGQGSARRLVFRTNVGDVVEAGEAHPLRFAAGISGSVLPYVHVRADLWARASRPVWYELAELVEEGPDGGLGLWAGGRFHALPEGSMGDDERS